MLTTLSDLGRRVLRWAPAHLAFLAVAAVLLGVVALMTWGAAEVYESVTEREDVALLDRPVMQLMVHLRSGVMTALAVAVTEAGGRIGLTVLAVLALAALTWARRDWTPIVLLVPAFLGSLTLTVVGKELTARVRPPSDLALPPFETSPSFPSGHTLNATVAAVTIGYLVLLTVRSTVWRRLVLALCLTFAVTVGLSRVYLGQHWLTDVICGWLVGAGWALSVVLAHRVWLEVRPPRPAP